MSLSNINTDVYDILKKVKRFPKKPIKKRSAAAFVIERPKTLKFSNSFKKPIKNKDSIHRVYDSYSVDLKKGIMGFRALSSYSFNITQVEAVRKYLVKKFKKKKIRIAFKIAFNNLITKKGLGVRMGKGKGKIDSFTAIIESGQIFLEIEGYITVKSFWMNFYLFNTVFRKLPFSTSLAYRY